MEVAHEELVEAFEEFEARFGSGDDFEESQGGLGGVRQRRRPVVSFQKV